MRLWWNNTMAQSIKDFLSSTWATMPQKNRSFWINFYRLHVQHNPSRNQSPAPQECTHKPHMLAYFDSNFGEADGRINPVPEPMFVDNPDRYPQPSVVCSALYNAPMSDVPDFLRKNPEYQSIRPKYKIRKSYYTGKPQKRRNLP